MNFIKLAEQAKAEIEELKKEVSEERIAVDEYRKSVIQKENRVRDRERALEIQNDKVSKEIGKLEKLQADKNAYADLEDKIKKLEELEESYKVAYTKAIDAKAELKHDQEQFAKQVAEFKEKSKNYKKKILVEFEKALGIAKEG